MNGVKRLLPTLALALVAMAAAQPLPGSVVVGGCAKGFVQPSLSALTRNLSLARGRWQRSGIRSYSYTLDELSQPLRFPSTRVTVAGGVVKAQALEAGQPSALAQRASVEALFEAVRQAIAHARTSPCRELRVSYAPDGHPLSFSSESHRMNVMDGGASWTVTEFRRL